MDELLRARLELIFEWYKGMVREDELLQYVYYPLEDRFEGDSPVREIGSIWDIEILGEFLGRRDLEPTALANLARYRRHLMEREGALLLSPEFLGEPSSIAHSAFLILALLHSRATGREEAVKGLADGIVGQQRGDGSYRIFFDGRADEGLEFYPGEAMLALLEAYGVLADERYLESAERGLLHYERRHYDAGFVESELLVFHANWQSQTGVKVFQATRKEEVRREAGSYLLALHDRIIGEGFYEGVARFPLHQATVEVACGLEGLNEAYAVAEKEGDPRAARYRRSICVGLAYLLRAQCVTNCTERERGGFGHSLLNRVQRIDVTGHAVGAILKTIGNRISC